MSVIPSTFTKNFDVHAHAHTFLTFSGNLNLHQNQTKHSLIIPSQHTHTEDDDDILGRAAELLPEVRRVVEGVLEVLHRRKELFHEAVVAEGHDLVADSDDDDLARMVEGDHVGVDLVLGEVRVRG
jgi:hypothetical protein